ncbi:BZ3500_MvSof-1268-A1-R1_C057g00252 [Microbotryum saponariae]|uniref:BZ3500_MvSof-1268-A1-R1_C057g00252 protein n=1 Tax=Microbotryum saponariae TaxID=289078 RepID=A0A2X0KP53_9BASI|nr:BZ3500_MvSof-1268-A1-R1_C057g00252 [Microbotryum saponariae]
MTTTPPLATGANLRFPAEQLAHLTSLLSARTLGWCEDLRELDTPTSPVPTDDIRSYVLDGIAPDDWTPSQRSARDAVAREVLANSIDSAEVSAVLDKIPTAT